jgi:hypothetical protein
MRLELKSRKKSAINLVLSAIVIGLLSNLAYAANVGDQLFKLTASDAAAEDHFGWSVAISGSLAVVGSIEDDHRRPNGATDEAAGSAYIFDLATGQQLHKLLSSDPDDTDRFGNSVAIQNKKVIVGAFFGNGNSNSSGAAYLFDAATGSQLLKLKATDGQTFDQFGTSVAINGNLALVGAPNDDDGAPNAGAAYLFDVLTGQQLMKLTASDPAESDHFGGSVAFNDNIALIGSPLHDSIGTNSGTAYVLDISTGVELLRLSPSDPAEFAAFGHSVAVSGNVAIVGAYIKDEAGDHSGAAYLFDVTTGQQLHKLIPSDAAAEDHFGFAVSIDRGLALVSAHRDIHNANLGVGSAYLFDVNTGQEILRLKGADTVDRDRFGQSVALGSGFAIVGASEDANTLFEQGSAYVFSVVPEPSTISFAVVGVGFLVLVNRSGRRGWCVPCRHVCSEITSHRLFAAAQPRSVSIRTIAAS